MPNPPNPITGRGQRNRRRGRSATSGLLTCTLALGLTTTPAVGAAPPDRLDVAVTDSLCPVLSEAADQFLAENAIQLRLICKSSERLAKGLPGQAARADYFISASRHWMEYAVNQGVANRTEITELWANRLVVAVPADSPLTIQSLDGLLSEAAVQVILGDPGTAPSGRYAKQAMENAGIWEQIRPKISSRNNAALAARGLAAAAGDTVGLLYATDVGPGLRILFEVPEALHSPIRYYGAPVRGTPRPAAVESLTRFLTSESAARIFRQHGFRVCVVPADAESVSGE